MDIPKEKFTIDLRLPTTPVKDQGSSSLCWVYGMLATLETEHIMRGDSVNLSPDYVARMYLSEQANRRRLLPNKVVQKEAGITTRGMCTMALDLIQPTVCGIMMPIVIGPDMTITFFVVSWIRTMIRRNYWISISVRYPIRSLC